MSGLRWWWVRHGPTHCRGAVGWTDVPVDLSDTDALDRLARALPAGAPVVSSDLRRARETASAICGDRPRLPDEPALRELNFGEWEMLDFDVIEQRHPEAARGFWSDPERIGPSGGETLRDLNARVSRVVDTMNARPPAQDVIVVAHAGVIRNALTVLPDMSQRTAMAFHIAPLSVTRLDWLADSSAWRVDRVNHVL